VPAEENDNYILGWGLSIIWALLVVSFFSAPFYKGTYILHMKDGTEKTLVFANHKTALAFYDWVVAQVEIARSRG
jgi:hypothetical protein